MDLALFTGIPASGKSSFYKERFADSHIRLNLDMLRTRHREAVLFEACLVAKQPVVIDNTNLTRSERSRYIEPARLRGFSVRGFYFRSVIEESLRRNAARSGRARIEDRGVRGAAARMEMPSLDEGLDELSYVRLEDGEFLVEPWRST